ncbi:hypothetical protein A1704_00240 [Chryseobacterium cucumeris]|uniref:hypothetical protein n=1 Tax=Chryseobacterium cucumeris TaxID=1813611 RepID=UPI000787B720|nr:hypothetical protein [Chryseobacterium cucumeris]KYH07144.1 hypothetical protein A1704_00240 [Chryseobacterium cucumeris]
MNNHFFKAGNFANNYGNQDYTITEYDIEQMERFDTDAFLPIPLSEEWLVKLGFEMPNEKKEKINTYSKDVNDQEILKIVVEDGDIMEFNLLRTNDFGEKSYEHITNQSKFFTVHYLQNLMKNFEKPGFPYR